MGSEEKEAFHKADESPVHNVTVSPFFMAEVEVTWDQYWAFYGNTMSEGRTPPETVYANNSNPNVDAISGPTPPFGFPDQGWGGGDRPAITMTHYAAETFCQWLSKKTGKTYRLPTEAEWEYACRAGTYTLFSAGDGLPATCLRNQKVARDFEPVSLKVGQTPPNAFGLYDMHGNVEEWCLDWYAPYSGEELEDPAGPLAGEFRVTRGGSHHTPEKYLRSANRMAMIPVSYTHLTLPTT